MRDRLDEIREHLVKLLNFTVFSKTKFNENLEDAELLEVARKRFERSLPLQHIDIVLVECLEDPPEEEEKEPTAEQASAHDSGSAR